MSKSRRASRTRGPRSDPAPPKAGPELASLDLLRVAADLVTALADAVVVTSRERWVLTGSRAAAERCGRPLDGVAGTALDEIVASGEGQDVAERERRALAREEERFETRMVSG